MANCGSEKKGKRGGFKKEGTGRLLHGERRVAQKCGMERMGRMLQILFSPY